MQDDDLESGPDAPAWARPFARAPEVTPPWRPTKGDLVGGTIRVEDLLGEGGFGAVYRARQLAPLDRAVAIKILSAAGAGDTFEREARATARIRHPNVVTIHTFGREQGTPYLILELLDGQTLAERVQASELTLAEALAIGADIAAALRAAHLQGVTHRDLSPRNVFCTKDGEVKVLDFGFAALEREIRTQRSAGTHRGPADPPEPSPPSARAGHGERPAPRRGGTPGYMDPRQADGTDEPRASDLFGLGALLFLLVARRPPHSGDTLDGYLAAVRSGPPPRLRDIVPATPRDLDELVASLLDPDTSKRPSAEESRDRLRELLHLVEARVSPAQRRRRRKPLVTDPFRPLRAFAAGDAELFFGRDREIDTLASLVRENRLTVLHGPSGTGKSSLLQAGLRPAIETEMTWLDIAPPTDATAEPVALLEASARAAFAAIHAPAPASGADEMLAALAERTKRPVLVVFDQFEELFQRRSKEQILRAATDLAKVLRRTLSRSAPVFVLFSVRADYFGQLTHLKAELPGIFEKELLLEPLGQDATRLAIERPFELGGFELPASLTERIRKDLTDEGHVSPVELQLVCHALHGRALELGERAVSGDSYAKLGGAGQVVTEHLLRAERDWPAGVRDAAWPILHRLIGTGGVRAPPKAALALARETGLSEDAVDQALAQLTEARITQPTERATQEAVMHHRIAHDRMGRAVWDQMTQEQRSAVLARELIEAEMPREPNGLIGNASFFLTVMPAATRERLLRWHADGAKGASGDERAFVGRLAKWRRRAHRAPRIGIPAVAVAVVTLVVFLWLRLGQERAAALEQQARAAEANAERELEHDPGKALAWIAEAARLRGGFEAEEERYYHHHWLLAQEAWRSGAGWVVANHGKKEVRWVGFSPSEADYRKATGKDCPQCWPHQKRLFSAGKDGVVRVLDLVTRELTLLPEPAPEGFNVAVISPDGTWIAASGFDGRVYVWDLVSRRRTVLSAGDSNWPAAAVEVSPDGTWIAMGHQNGAVDLWRRRTAPTDGEDPAFEHHRTLRGHKVNVRSLAFSPTGDRLASVDDQGQVRSTLLPGGDDEWLAESRTSPFGHAVQFSPDGNKLGVAVGTEVLVFDKHDKSGVPQPIAPDADTVTGLGFFALDDRVEGLVVSTVQGDVSHWLQQSNRWQRQGTRHAHAGAVTRLVIQPPHVLSAGMDGRVFLGELETWTTRLFRGHDGRVAGVARSPDGKLVASGGVDGVVRFWQVAEGLVSVRNPPSSIRSLVAPQPEAMVVAGLNNGQLVTWRGATPAPTVEPARGGPVHALCMWPDGRIASASQDRTLEISSVNDEPTQRRTDLPSGSLVCLPYGKLLSGGNPEIRRLDVGKATIETIGQHEDLINSLALLPGGKLVSGSYDGTVALWDLTGRRKLGSLALGARVSSVSPLGGDEVVAALMDGRLVRWSPPTGEQHPIEPPHAGAVMAVSTHPQARLLASAGEDALVLRWVDSAASREIKGHEGAVQTAVFSQDGRHVVSGGVDSTVRIWPLPPVDRPTFRTWLAARTPYTIEHPGADAEPKPEPKPLDKLPPLDPDPR